VFFQINYAGHGIFDEIAVIYWIFLTIDSTSCQKNSNFAHLPACFSCFCWYYWRKGKQSLPIAWEQWLL